MDRRRFLGVGASAIAAVALGGCATRGAGRSALTNAAAFHASRRFDKTRFGRIAYVERGKGPAALFLRGLPLNGFHTNFNKFQRCQILKLAARLNDHTTRHL